ncbi:MAG: hypothetical protein AABZ64_07900 [Nitrospinota bacterium]|mgnify:CR=1 FL=1
MAGNINVALGVVILWLLVLTVAFVIHWIKVERHLEFNKQGGSKVSEGLKAKVLGKG